MTPLDTSVLDNLVNNIADVVKAGRTPEEAVRRLSGFVPEETLRAALERFRELTRRIRTMREPGGIIDPYGEPWYTGPVDGDKFWPDYHARLAQNPDWDDAALQALDGSSTQIVALLRPPAAAQIRSRGLVLGHVQSGKTANFTAVIAKAADAGYRFFIVLSGLNNALRNQTQERLEEDLRIINSADWITVTDSARDFRETRNVNAFLADQQSAKILGVIKKNKPRLERLIKWLKQAQPTVLQACPVLVIDDEADQASPNSHPNPDERTAINGLIVELLLSLPKAAYVGYTATPFANLFIDPTQPHDLYPRDFIVDLPRGDGYFGSERIFGRPPITEEDAGVDGLDMIRIVPADEVPLLKSSAQARDVFVPDLTESLREALLYFWLATAARLARGQRKKHSTMLVHTSQYSAVHASFKPVLTQLQSHVLSALRDRGEMVAELKSIWEKEHERVPSAAVGERSTSFEELFPFLDEAVSRTEVKVENSRSTDRIYYRTEENEPGRIYVVVGGNVLSRGLTLSGLVVSYFVRSASAYDTLLQMGRWFGYRQGYADLPRVWMTKELRGFFFDLAAVEKEIRIEIERYKGGHVTPLEFAVRVRTHPQLAITSKLKMQHAVAASMSFGGREVQTIVFRYKDPVWLDRNMEAARTLIASLRATGRQPIHVQDRPHLIFLDVASEEVLRFLTDYQIDPSNSAMPADLLRGYIQEQNARSKISMWTVAVVTRRAPVPELGTIDLSLDAEVPLVNRARFERGRDPALGDIKALLSEIDPAVDVDLPTSQLRTMTRAELLKLRDVQVPDRGLLLLYPISKDSRSLGRDPDRKPLEAAAHVLGIGLIFPAPDEDTPQSYMTVSLAGVVEHADPGDLPEEDE